MSMIARDAALCMHEHHHVGSAIPASQMDGKTCKISTAGSYRAMYRQYRRARTSPFVFALAASRPQVPADQIKLRAENVRTSSTDDGVD
jgi:hypothetical protein